MDDKFYLQLNIWNLITVNLMVILGFALLGLAASFMMGNDGDTSDA